MIRLARFLTALAIPIVLVTAGVWLVASEPFLAFELGRPALPPPSGMTAEARMALAIPSTLYIVRPIDRSVLEGLQDHGAPLYTALEIDHLDDVRALVTKITGLSILGLVWILAGYVLWRRGSWSDWPRALANGGRLTLATVFVVAVAVGLAWPWFFTTFHEVFFPQGNWSFPVDSGLIRLFPEPFWLDVAISLVAFVAAGGAAVWGLGRRLSR